MDKADIILRAYEIAGPPAPVINNRGVVIKDKETGEPRIESPAEHEARVALEAMRILAATDPKSKIYKQLEEFDAAKGFVGTIVAGEQEERTGRYKITLSAYSKRKGEVVEEFVRTKHMNTAEGMLMAREASKLIGHRVIVHKFNEEKADGSGDQVGVLVYLTDLGEDKGDKR